MRSLWAALYVTLFFGQICVCKECWYGIWNITISQCASSQLNGELMLLCWIHIFVNLTLKDRVLRSPVLYCWLSVCFPFRIPLWLVFWLLPPSLIAAGFNLHLGLYKLHMFLCQEERGELALDCGLLLCCYLCLLCYCASHFVQNILICYQSVWQA